MAFVRTTTAKALAVVVTTTTAVGTDNANDSAQTDSIHPIWMWDAVSSDLQPQP